MPNGKAFEEKSVDDWDASSVAPLIASSSKDPDYTLDTIIHFQHNDPDYKKTYYMNRLSFHIQDHRKAKTRFHTEWESLTAGKQSDESKLREIIDWHQGTFKLYHQDQTTRDTLMEATTKIVEEITSKFEIKTPSTVSKGSIVFCERGQSNCKLKWPKEVPHNSPPSSINADSG